MCLLRHGIRGSPPRRAGRMPWRPCPGRHRVRRRSSGSRAVSHRVAAARTRCRRAGADRSGSCGRRRRTGRPEGPSVHRRLDQSLWPGMDLRRAIARGQTRAVQSSLSVPQGAALSVAAVLGTGVITLPALGVQVAGPASLIAWIALVALSVPLAATFAAMGARHPDSRGVSAYVDRAFGPRAAGAIGWCFYFAVPVGAPPASLMAGGYVADAIGGGHTTALVTAVALIVGVAVLNAAGLRLSGRVQLVLTALLALLISVAVVVAAPHGTAQHLTPFAPHGVG